MESTKRFLLGLAVGLFFMELCGYSQNLADIAQQEKEKRAKQKKSAKIYTNEDLHIYNRGEAPTSGNPASQTETSSQPIQKLLLQGHQITMNATGASDSSKLKKRLHN